MRLVQRVLAVLVALAGALLFLGLVDGSHDQALLGGLLFVILLGLMWLEELRSRRS